MDDYMSAARRTDRLPTDDTAAITTRLLVAIANVVAAVRSNDGNQENSGVIQDGLGDVLWYVAAMGRRFRLPLKPLLTARLSPNGLSPHGDKHPPPRADDALIEFGRSGADFLAIDQSQRPRELIARFITIYLATLKAVGMTLNQVIEVNSAKVQGRFMKPDPASLPVFDEEFNEDERLPQKFEISIKEGRAGQAFMKWNGVFIGDPLTDNRHDTDGYRFHDVFHFANAAILHWSPAFRGLIMHKRKSDEETDEVEDGGRAIVVEEGLTNWLFARAKKLDFFEGHDAVPYEILKTIRQFVSGYEVEACPMKLWEESILQGYTVFRQVAAHKGGIVAADRRTRKIAYKPLGATWT